MSGNLSHSMRNNYDTHGVSGYYSIVSESYRNPHFAGLKKVMNDWMDRYMLHEKPTTIRVLDLAAGSGEATEALLTWKSSRWPSAAPTAPPPAPSPAPAVNGRPSFPIRAVVRPTKTAAAPTLPEPELLITASDPFTFPGYRARTGLPCLELSFNDVAAGQLPPPPKSTKEPTTSLAASAEEGEEEAIEPYDVVFISFALHLVESTSELWGLLTELSKRARWLVVTAPHKKPDIKPSWGWRRWDPSPKWTAAEGRGNVGGAEGDGFEIVLDRVRLRVWRSEEFWEG